MERHTPPIQPLPSKAVAQIKSSTIITHLNGVVSELLRNSLDAGARTVTIKVDHEKGGCMVEDDASGIPPGEFEEGGGLGKLHHTSKFNCGSEVYGPKGAFLASLGTMALLTITSSHVASQRTNTLVMHHSKTIARLCPAPLQHQIHTVSGHGTRVTVTDLFGNMPVRVKHRAMTLQRHGDLDREWEDLRSIVTGLLLAFQKPVKVVALDGQGTRRLLIRDHTQHSTLRGPRPHTDRAPSLDLDQILSVLSQAGYITPKDFGSWVVSCARTSDVSVESAISLQPSPTRQVQFVSFGISPLPATSANILYNEINRIFATSSFGVEDYAPDSKEMKGPFPEQREEALEPDSGKISRPRNKGVNRRPMFVTRVSFENSGTDMNNDPFTSGDSLQRTLDVVCALFRQFLEHHQFSRSKHEASENKFQVTVPSYGAAETTPITRPRSGAAESTPPIGKSNGGSGSENRSDSSVKPSTAFKVSDPERGVTRGDFGAWSRIKSGRKEFFDDICSGLPRSQKMTQNSAGEKLDYRSSMPPSKPLSCPASPVAQEDTSNPLTSYSRTHGISDRQLQEEALDESTTSADGAIRWTNPATKDTVLVNQRTGQTIPTTKRDAVSRQVTGSNSARPPKRLPFMKRVDSGGPSKPSVWLDSLLKEWVNPVFPQTECAVPSTSLPLNSMPSVDPTRSVGHLSSEGSLELGFNPSSTRFTGRLTKEGLRSAQVISQVDDKFLLIKVAATGNSIDAPDILVLVDQHAADERCRVELLFDELCGFSVPQSVNYTSLADPISFKVRRQEGKMFEARSKYFASWGCLYRVSKDAKKGYHVRITELPTLIAERCRVEPKLAIDMLRAELWAQHDDQRKAYSGHGQTSGEKSAYFAGKGVGEDQHVSTPWLRNISSCPKGIVDMLNSRACRTAIMFNDPLPHDECKDLLSRLAQCAFPYQCAHGRPTMVPIVNIQSTGSLPSHFLDSDYTLDNAFSVKEKRASDFFGVFKAWINK